MSAQLFACVFATSALLAAKCAPVLEIGLAKMTPEQVHHLQKWTDDDKQNIWELSGQFEGDIVLSKDNLVGERNGIRNPKLRWPNGEIPYEIDENFTQEQKDWIVNVLNTYDETSCVKARPRTSTDKDYVYITAENTGCHSSVGRVGGRQTLNLQPAPPGSRCLRFGTILHEFLHALGFFHQQSASNRDDYISIEWNNIRKGNEHNFYKHSEEEITDLGVPYDYDSIMHYSAYAFSANGEKTIVPKFSGVYIGQRDGLSAGDIEKLHNMYNCTGLV